VTVEVMRAASRPDARVLSDEPRVFASDLAPPDAAALQVVRHGVRAADLVAPPVVLPDFYHKADMEMPSSTVVATRDTIRLPLTSASLNCGMALLALDMGRPHARAVAEFYRRVRRRYPYPPPLRRELAFSEVLRAAAYGGRFSADRFGIDPAELDRVEEGGRLDLEPYGGQARLRRDLPWLAVQLARMRFGTVGPSTHFVELQEVEELVDPVAAAALGVERGQVTLQYHGGDGVLNIQMGSLFGRRKGGSPQLHAALAVVKPLYHLARSRSLPELHRRWSLYFSDGCPAIARGAPEGERLMLANAVAMNYGFAYRLATYASLRAIAREVFGVPGRLVVDSPHNSIYEEPVAGQVALVHRHNACRAYPPSRMQDHPVFGAIGQALLLPGTHRTSSYLCVASEGAAESLFSACHGSGTIIEELVRRGLSRLHPGRHATLRFRYSDAAPAEVPHLDDRGVNEALGILMRHDLVRPVARLRPLAVLN